MAKARGLRETDVTEEENELTNILRVLTPV
jgi:hypothetical protein